MTPSCLFETLAQEAWRGSRQGTATSAFGCGTCLGNRSLSARPLLVYLGGGWRRQPRRAWDKGCRSPSGTRCCSFRRRKLSESNGSSTTLMASIGSPRSDSSRGHGCSASFGRDAVVDFDDLETVLHPFDSGSNLGRRSRKPMKLTTLLASCARDPQRSNAFRPAPPLAEVSSP